FRRGRHSGPAARYESRTMHSSAWAALLRHIPAEQHNQLALVTVGGTEIAVQCFLRVDHEFLALKGRLAGSQDAGRGFVVAFCQIDYIGFVGEVKESEFQQMFGGLAVPAPSANGTVDRPPPEPEPPTPEGKPGSGPRPAIRSEVLERYRSGRPGSSPALPRV